MQLDVMHNRRLHCDNQSEVKKYKYIQSRLVFLPSCAIYALSSRNANFHKIINSLREERGIYFELEKKETGVPFVTSLRPLATFLRTFLNINTIHTGLLFASYDRGRPGGPPSFTSRPLMIRSPNVHRIMYSSVPMIDTVT